MKNTDMLDRLHGYYLEDLEIGTTGTYARTVSDADITLFAGLTGDDNPVHFNEEFARSTPLKGRVAQGMLTACFIAGAGSRCPGAGAIYLEQTVRFTAPVRPGDTVVATVTVKNIEHERRRVTTQTTCRVGDKVVLEGEGTFLVDSKARSA